MRLSQHPRIVTSIGAVSGFTLIELLVVMAVISGLLAILLPALGRIRTVARRTVCGAHLRQIALAWNAYLDAYNGRFFYRVNCQYDFGGWQGNPTEAVNRPLNKLLGLPPTVTTETEARVFRCPADDGGENDPVSTYLRHGNSYQTNPMLLYPDQVGAAQNWAAEPWRTIFSIIPGKITRDHAAEPSRLLLVGDCYWTDQYDPLWMTCGKSWHGDRHYYNLAFLDGHVAYLKVRKGLYVAPDYRVQPFKEIDPAVMELQKEVPCACGKQ